MNRYLSKVRIQKLVKEITVFLVLVSIFLPATTNAFNEKTQVYNHPSVSPNWVTRPYDDLTGSGWINASVNIITAQITHRLGTVERSLTVEPGNSVNFTYNPPDPSFEFNGWWEGLPIKGCSGIEDIEDRTGCDIRGTGRMCQDIDTLCIERSETEKIAESAWAAYYDRTEGFTIVTAQPPIRFTSSNPSVVTCSGLRCTGIAPGSATVTATISQNNFRVWLFGKENREYRGGTAIVPGTTFSWTINVGAPYVDIGLRVAKNGVAIPIAAEPLGTLTSPLRVAKNGNVYGVVLVELNDPAASPARVYTRNGIKALRRL